jgi:hypothetical protein
MAELTSRQWKAIKESRQAMREVLKKAYPGDFARLWASAVTADFIAVASASLHHSELMGVVNGELVALGLELAKKRRH